ncbi:MAG: polysaccharide biosynthesis tyrosine autokinase [Proteobacteria bacterium]|nr:polysaccharide biosynthesis tyrosine autokinase [Pseudomonadota bacterium]
MKLRKALDKARKNREGSSQTEMPEKERFKEEIPTDDWRQPVYSQSTQIELSTEAVIENRCVCIEPDSPEIDCYKVLRTKIQQMTQEKGWNTVMITSPRSGDGKTLTAINLALTFSKTFNQTILLVDCDLRKQDVHKLLGFHSESGLVDYLVNDRPLNEFIIWPSVEKLTLISGGRMIQNSTELLGSPRMKKLVEEIKLRYDDRYVLFDVPPVLGSADTLALVPFIDSIVMVVEEGKTSTRDVQKALEVLPKEKFLGFVMNKQKKSKNFEDPYRVYGKK